ncbi:aminoacyl-tRNA hydrolase [Mesorhizobium mediterraneum]|uniref:Peptidyl-tRNA hydrolase n=1 Tax=Mesorhizobium mediterraneum TaxID=43617 RepID=A0AB36R0I5_9HYPH|nr:MULTISPECIES: aminoacyl-tRNA hydrolase [Mesorhizobium]PAP98085.1 aminoacyl-tRNA hydrolase [Mesorhizobium mediterraneum]RUU25125.1 aminoacyl-tRNA hydrolase [Mesorhizobium sp. M6A.T.Ce.TU.016.01.1.1]RWN25794.1 MAG: aminoacyl-tRNA hydrolase [Mesorhizobium sp.]WIW55961.1 aminoacyl-tRNA hydrolase [Mesorhizobium mediterraneum]
MLLFAGLGNPGAKYANNRHNVGFMAADAIGRRHSFSPWSKKFQGLIAEGTLAGEKIILIKPQTFMNNSGQSIGEALRFYKLTPSALTVFYDEIDLADGKVRVKTGGGAGGHNGIRSIDGHVGNAYRRVRIGVGHPGVKEFVQHHVLGDFAKADREWLEPLLDAIGDHADLIVRGDESGFMNKVSVAVQRKTGATPERENAGSKQQSPKQQSHVRQARQQPAVKLPQTGPMAAMLKKLFGGKD